MSDVRRDTEVEFDPVLGARFDALATIEVPDVWADATARGRAPDGDRVQPVPVVLAPARTRPRRRPAPWLTGVAAVAGLVGVIALIAAVRRPITEPPAAAATTTIPALAIDTLSTTTVDGSTTVELDLTYASVGDDSVPNAVYVLREGATFPEAIAFTGCLATDDIQSKLIQPAYIVGAGVADATECGLGSIAIGPGDSSTVTITAGGLTPGSYRIAIAGWGSEPFEVAASTAPTASTASTASDANDPTRAADSIDPPSVTAATDAGSTAATIAPLASATFTPLSLQEAPRGYLFASAVRDRSGDVEVGFVRFAGPAGEPDLVLVLRAAPDFFATALDLGRETWPVNGRTVVVDGEGDGSCLPDVCSVGVQWDETTAVSVMWATGESGAELTQDHTLESLVVIAATLMEVEPSVFVEGTLAP